MCIRDSYIPCFSKGCRLQLDFGIGIGVKPLRDILRVDNNVEGVGVGPEGGEVGSGPEVGPGPEVGAADIGHVVLLGPAEGQLEGQVPVFLPPEQVQQLPSGLQQILYFPPTVQPESEQIPG